MCTKNRGYIIALSILFCASVSKGQTSRFVTHQDTLSIPRLYVSNNQIYPLIDSVICNWENSILKNILSYAIIVPHKNFNGDTIWHIQVKQLYDFDAFYFVLPSWVPNFARLSIPYGLLNINDRDIYIGIEKNAPSHYEKNASGRIIEGYFQKDTGFAIFTRNVLEYEINKSSFLMECDTIHSSFPPETVIYKYYYALEMDYAEVNKSFVLLRREVVKSPWY